MTNSIKGRKLKFISYKTLSVLLTLIMLFGMTNVCFLTTSAAVSDGGFNLKLKWNGASQNPSVFENYSDCDESQLVRLKILYENKEVSTGYEPGEIIISLPGLKGAVRSGNSYQPAAIAADKVSDSTKIYDWSYSYSSTSDTFTFTNNSRINANSTFEGSFEIIWKFPSRQTINGFSKNIQAKLRTSKNDQTLSNEVLYSQIRERDEYTLTQEGESIAAPISSAEGLLEILPEGAEETDYSWVKYNVYGTDNYRARDVQGSERFECWFLEGTLIKGGNLAKTGETKEIDGKIYECWSVYSDISNKSSLFLSNIYAAYPNDKYKDQQVCAYVELLGTYYDETDETTLATAAVQTNLKDFGFIDLPGDIYDAYKYSYGLNSSYINAHCETCQAYGAVNNMHLTDGSQKYRSTLRVMFNYHKENNNKFDLEYVDDIMDIVTSDDVRQLSDDEYNFTNVIIPAASDVKNANGFAIEADKYGVEIYLRRAGSKFESEPYSTTVVSSAQQSIDLPEDTVGIKIIVKGVQESLETMDITLYYKFHTDAEDFLTAASITNNMYFNLYENGKWVNNNFGKETYVSDREYYRDIELYGNSFDREAFTLHIIEVPNEYSSTTDLKKQDEDKEAYYFTGSISGNFNVADGNSLSKFSMYTIVPDEMKLQPLYSDADALIDQLTFNSNGYSSTYIKEHAALEVINNYKGSGRQYIAIHYDFSDAPITSRGISVSGIPMYFEKDAVKAVSKNFTMHSLILIDQSGKWYASSNDNNTIENNLWNDIDGDGNIEESAAYSNSSVTIYNPESSNLQFTKSVSTGMTNGYVQPAFDQANGSYLEDEMPYTYKDYEYSYKLRLKTGENLANNVIFVDSLETGVRKEWQGTFVRVDTTNAENLIGVKPTVYYSSKAVDPNSKPNLSSSDWTTKKPASVKSIAVDFGDAMLRSGSSFYIEIYMKAPKDENRQFDYKITENFAHIYYDKYDVNTGDFLQSQDLPSNDVPVSLIPFMGTIKIIKTDSTDQSRLSGAVYKLYEMLGNDPDTANDRLISENLKTDENGVASIKAPYGKYYIIETKAPLGYVLDSRPQKIVLDADKPDITVTVTMENERKDGQFTLRKVSDRNRELYLPGAEFAVYSAESDKIVQEKLVTDENGELTVEGLEWGSYYLKETKPPKGYKLSDQKISFQVNAGNDAQGTATVENEQIPGTVILVKTEVLEDGITKTDLPLDGAAYQLFDSNNKPIGTYMTDDNGKIYVDDLAFGSYYFKETIAAQGYHLYTEKIQFTIGEDDLKKDNTISKTVQTTDQRLLGSLWLQKLDDVGGYVKNAEYALFRASDDVQVDETGKQSNKIFKTSDEGIIEINGIYWGEYYIKEIKSPLGYDINEEKYPVIIDRDTVNTMVTVHAVDNRSKGSIELTKVDENDETVTLPNAVYTLYKSDGTVYRSDLKTDKNGKLKVDNIEWGSYYFMEKTAPPGYGLSDEKIRFSVNYLTAGKVQQVTAKDPMMTGEIAVTKLIKIDDIIFSHGNPIFTFELVGTDVNGKEYTFYKNVTFNEIFVKDYITANPNSSYVEQSVVFTNLPAGSWTVSEMKTVRYELDKVEAKTANGSVNGETVVFKLDNANGYEGKADFTNEKTYQSSTTHTSQAVNIVKTDRKLTALVAIWNGESTVTSERLDRTKLDVYAVYDDGSQAKLDDSDYELDPEIFDETMNGDYTVTAKYSEGGKTFSDSFALSLNLPSMFTWTVKDSAFEENGIRYDGTATITGYTGESSVMNIPSSVTGIRTLVNYDSGSVTYNDNGKTYKVVAVVGNGTKAVYGMTNISKVIIPSVVEQIGDYTFCSSDKLTSVEIASNSHLTTIGNSAFQYCSEIRGTGLEIPASVRSIGNNAFESCRNIPSLRFKSNSQLKTIGDYAFYDCTSLSGALTIPANVEYIGQNSFGATVSGYTEWDGSIGVNYNLPIYSGSLNNLTSLSFESGSKLKVIGDSAFCNASGLTGVLEIPSGVEEIGERAFANCTGLTGVDLEGNSSLLRIKDGAFQSCTSLTGKLVIPSSVQEIGIRAFGGTPSKYFSPYSGYPFHFDRESYLCSNITNLVIHNDADLKIIGDYAFEGMNKNTESLIIPKGVEKIGNYAFSSHSSSTGELLIPKSTVSIGDYAFQYCNNLNALKFENGSKLEYIGDYSFYRCENLTGELKIPASVTTIGTYAFGNNLSSYSAKFTSLVFEENSNLKTIGNYALAYISAESDLKLPSKLEYIGNNAFYYCENLTGNLIIPESVTYLGSSAFRSCSGLEGLSFAPNSKLTSINYGAFEYCSGLTGNLIIPDSVTTIESYAFGDCRNLDGKLILPKNLTTLGYRSFNYCNLTGELVIPDTVTTIKDCVFQGCTNFTGDVRIPSGITDIGGSIFTGCSGIATVYIPSSLGEDAITSAVSGFKGQVIRY